MINNRIAEHSGIRIIAYNNILQKGSAELIDFNKFLLNIHVNIEETFIFYKFYALSEKGEHADALLPIKTLYDKQPDSIQ